jgi:hypothetical protein
MTDDTSPIYVYGTHAAAEDAIRALSRSGFDMKRLSLIGKGHHSEELPVGFSTKGDRIVSWGRQGAFWGAIWGLLFAPAVFFLPGLGLVSMANTPSLPTTAIAADAPSRITCNSETIAVVGK